jgi:hypothetical protein
MKKLEKNMRLCMWIWLNGLIHNMVLKLIMVISAIDLWHVNAIVVNL